MLTRVYQFGTRINTPDGIYRSGWYRYITDHLGSPRLLVRVDNGTIGQRMDYNDVGRVIADSSPGFQAYGFAGGIYLNTENLVKFGARMYDPVAGRWLTKDPILFGGGDTNLFGYVLNDPVNFVDPNGKFFWPAVGAAAVVGGAAIYDVFSENGFLAEQYVKNTRPFDYREKEMKDELKEGIDNDLRQSGGQCRPQKINPKTAPGNFPSPKGNPLPTWKNWG